METMTTSAAGYVPEQPLTVVGAVPPELARQMQSVPAPQAPDLTRLPRPGERDPITGSSRSWLIDTNEALPPSERFLFRVKQRNKLRGCVFVNVGKLKAFLQKAEEADTGAAVTA